MKIFRNLLILTTLLFSLSPAQINQGAFLNSAKAQPQNAKTGVPVDVIKRFEKNFEKVKAIKVKGEVQVFLASASDSRIYQLQTKETKYNLYLKAATTEFETGDLISVTGLNLENTIIAEESLIVEKASVLQAVPANINDVLVIYHKFQDLDYSNDGYSGNNTISKAGIESNTHVAPNSVANFYTEASYNNFTFNFTVTNLLTTSYNAANSGCDLSLIYGAANSAAGIAGFNYQQYDHVVYLFPFMNTCTIPGGGIWAGLAAWPGSIVFLNGFYDQQVIAHELGHNIGLGHANRLECGSAVVGAIPPCSEVGYGDYFDTMGGGYAHFNASFKEAVGWLPGKVQKVTSSGTYTVYPIEKNDSTVKALKIYRPSTDDYYYLEYRQPIGFDSNLGPGVTSGALGHIGTGTGLDTQLLDFTPNQEEDDSGHVSLKDGLVFEDKIHGIKITQVSHDEDVALLHISFYAKDLPATSLLLSDYSPSSGQVLGATFQIVNTTSVPVTLQSVGVGASLNGRPLSIFSFKNDIVVNSGSASGPLDFEGVFPKIGQYSLWVSYKVNGTWYNAIPGINQKVARTINTHLPDLRLTRSIALVPSKIATNQSADFSFSIKNNEDGPVLSDCFQIALKRLPDLLRLDSSCVSRRLESGQAIDVVSLVSFSKLGEYYAWPRLNIGGSYYSIRAWSNQYFHPKSFSEFLPSTSLLLSDYNPANGQILGASFQIVNTTSAPVTLQSVGVGSSIDGKALGIFPFKNDIVIDPGSASGPLEFEGAFPKAGQYNLWVSYKANGTWYNAIPGINQRVKRAIIVK